MFPFPIAKPQGCDIQTFYGDGSSATIARSTWNKPIGVSHVYMLIIGAGAAGTGTSGGGSGAVTVWYGAAKNIPDLLYIWVGTGSSYVTPDPPGNYYIYATGGSGASGGAAMPANYWTAMGFFQSVAGMNGSTGAIGTPSATTFLSGGAASGAVVSNYGYGTSGTNEPGSFRMQPIIVGSGGSGTTSNPVPGGVGCGGAAASPSGKGGPGMILIASW